MCVEGDKARHGRWAGSLSIPHSSPPDHCRRDETQRLPDTSIDPPQPAIVVSYAKSHACVRGNLDRGGHPLPGVGWMRRLFLRTRVCNGNKSRSNRADWTYRVDRPDVFGLHCRSRCADRTRRNGIRKLCQFELGCRHRLDELHDRLLQRLPQHNEWLHALCGQPAHLNRGQHKLHGLRSNTSHLLLRC